MSSTALLKIPELRDLLSERLSQRDLVNCVRVSKSWHQGFTPPLWSKITISSLSQDIAFSQTARRAIRRHRQFIRSFSGHYPTSLRTLDDELLADTTGPTTDSSRSSSDDSGRFTELRELRRDCQQGESLLLRLVEFSPELRSLHLDGWCRDDSKLALLIEKLVHLKTLTIDGGSNNLLPLEDFRALLKYCPMSVETFSIQSSLKGNITSSNNIAAQSPPVLQTPLPPLTKPLRLRAIKYLSLRGSALNTDPTVWAPFLSNCHDLRSFSISGNMMNWNVQRIVEILQQNCPHLEELHLTEAGRCITDGFLAQFLSACDHPQNDTSFPSGDTSETNFTPSIQSLLVQEQQHQTVIRRPKWKVITVTALPEMGPASIEALLAHTPTLEKVTVVDGNIMDSDTQYRILSQSPYLDTFRVLPDREGVFGINPHQLLSPPQLPQGVMFVPWACESTLRTLFLAIQPATLSSEQQRLVMRQLGRLHNLTELRLCNECNGGYNIEGRRGFTDWTLTNGLDEWADMKALRDVLVLGFEHAFGEEEKAWVLEHWPELESMHVGKVVVISPYEI